MARCISYKITVEILLELLLTILGQKPSLTALFVVHQCSSKKASKTDASYDERHLKKDLRVDATNSPCNTGSKEEEGRGGRRAMC